MDIQCERADQRRNIESVIARFPAPLREALDATGQRVCRLKQNERYDEASSFLRTHKIDVDGWPAPPAGLYVVSDKTLFLRSHSAMTIAHELGHAVDCALGGGVYLSCTNERIRNAFKNARAFVTPYAATGLDEYFAESLRAYVEVNDAASFWPRVTKARLKRVDPEMFAILDTLAKGGTL